MPKSSTLTTAYSYDSVGNLLTQASSGASDIAFSYSYNKNGYITGEVRTENGQTTESSYAYDALGQLTSFLQSTGYGEQYAYDKAGNMTEKVITPLHSESEEAQAVTLKMSYNKGNQLTAMANGKDKITYSYDKNGSMVQKVLSSQTYGKLTDTYAYNALDQLTSYTGYDGYTQQFTYDANGMRLSRSEAGDANRSTLEELLRGNIAGLPGIVELAQSQTNANGADAPTGLEWATTEYLYDLTQEYYQVISETRTETNGHTATTAYAYGLERIAAYTADGKTSYVYDGRGSVVQTVTAPVAGEKVSSALPDVAVKVQSFLYTAFGEQMGAQKVSGFSYNAEAYDAATGMINLRARQYEPTIGRFNQKDVVRGNAGQPISLNRYLYCQNDGIDYIDPTGQSILGALIGTKVIKGTLIGAGLIIWGIVSGAQKANNNYGVRKNSSIDKLRSQEKQNEKKKQEAERLQERDHILASNSLCGPAPTPKTTPVPSSYVTSVAGSNAPNPNDHRDDDDKKDTKHGEKRKNERGFTKEKIEDITKNYSQKVYQPGGRTVYAKKTGGYYDVVIYNNEGKIITTVGGNTKSLKTWSDVVRMLNNNGGFSSLPILR